MLRVAQFPFGECEDDTALVDLGDLIRVCVPMSPGERMGADDHPLEYAPTSITCSTTPTRLP